MFRAEDTLAGLKPFQRDTVEYVFDRFFGQDPVDRFLVADEVGLGKTMVARGVIAKLIERHLHEAGRRIDIVYICSNQAIAKQNFSKLTIVGRESKAVTDRITTLPLHVRGLDKPLDGFDRGINIIPITPTTSLDLRSSIGRVDERALLWWLLTDDSLIGMKAMRLTGARRLFQPPVQHLESFEWSRKAINRKSIDGALWTRFIEHVDGATEAPDIRDELRELADAFRSERRLWIAPWRDRRIALVARLRRILAASCVHALEPDLVILDEFQRFPRLLDPSEPTGELAEQLFGYPDCKALLLSATPYRMFSRAHELDDEHYSDFMTTTRFLQANDKRSAELITAMGRYRSALRRSADAGSQAVITARDEIRDELTRVMCRTERLGAAGDRNGMLDVAPDHQLAACLAPSDLQGYAELEHVARSLGTRDVVEFWKSAPYALNLMDDYALSNAFEEQARSDERLPVTHRLDADTVRAYEAIDPGNARLRGLLERLDAEAAWKCLWLPPSLPYYAPGRPFNEVSLATKRLIFSSWKVVPKAIASLTSYHIDRQMLTHLGHTIENSQDGRKSLGQPLQWRAGGAMTEVLLTTPGRELARITDPLVLAAERARSEGLASRERLLLDAERNVKAAVRGIDLPDRHGRPDFAWYVVAMLRLDEAAHPGSVRNWLRGDALGAQEDHRVWSRHIGRLTAALNSNAQLGAVPPDLEQVLAYVGFAGAGACSLRAFQRLETDAPHAALSAHALRVANALRLMFNLPEAVITVRSFATRRARIQTTDDEVYWRAALDYCVAGNLQATLDEYLHVLSDWVGGADTPRKLQAITETAAEAIGINAASLPARNITSDGRVLDETIAFRSRFAVRLDKGQGEDQQSVQRVDTVRKAFNSPFWPFVLASTSIGQEGLDFHLYSHAVVHWNLPYNPVDLEQREGRVHRFKNHAVRRNLAAAQRDIAIAAAPGDPWRAMFDGAPEGNGGLEPYWVFRGDARIERHVPAEPLSIDRHRLKELVRLMGIYRLAFGQPRQDELLAALGAMGDDWQDLIIDLAPPAWQEDVRLRETSVSPSSCRWGAPTFPWP